MGSGRYKNAKTFKPPENDKGMGVQHTDTREGRR